MDYKKPQSTLVQGGTGIYPLTTADQVILADGSRLEKDGKIGADSAANSAKLGGKAPEYYLQPRNLLDNSDFRNPVNQRGVSSVTTTGYTIDRWFLQNAGDGISISDDGVTFNATNSLIVFLQKIDKEIRKVLIGKTITVAATDSSGNVGVRTCIVPNFGEAVDSAQNSIGDTGLKVNIYAMSNDDTLHIRLLSDSILSPVTIVNIALYEGSYTADTLPPYVPKGYAAELAECRLYYRPQQMYCLYCYAAGYAAGITFEPMRQGVIPSPVNSKAQTMTGDDIAGTTNIVIMQKDRITYVENPNFVYGSYYRVFSEFSSDL